MTVWKYKWGQDAEAVIEMPRGARVLHVAEQYLQPCLWVLVDPLAEKESRHFFLVGTGHEMPHKNARYVGTFLADGGQFVFHVFERVDTDAEEAQG